MDTDSGIVVVSVAIMLPPDGISQTVSGSNLGCLKMQLERFMIRNGAELTLTGEDGTVVQLISTTEGWRMTVEPATES